MHSFGRVKLIQMNLENKEKMSIEELEENLVELKSKGMNSISTLISLFDAYCNRFVF